jgi:hypothetical protein
MQSWCFYACSYACSYADTNRYTVASAGHKCLLSPGFSSELRRSNSASRAVSRVCHVLREVLVSACFVQSKSSLGAYTDNIAVAVSVYSTILANVQSSHAAKLIPAAAISAGLPASVIPTLLAALPLGADALAKVPGISVEIITAAGAALVQSYQIGLK